MAAEDKPTDMTRRQYYREWRKTNQYWEKAISRLVIFCVIMMGVLFSMTILGWLIASVIDWCMGGTPLLQWVLIKKMALNAISAPVAVFVVVFGELEIVMHQEYREWRKTH